MDKVENTTPQPQNQEMCYSTDCKSMEERMDKRLATLRSNRTSVFQTMQTNLTVATARN